MQKAAKLWYLEQFDLMKKLSKREREEMTKKITDKVYKKDEPIMFPFNSKKTIYILKKGVVKIGNYTETGEENLKYLINQGNIFGEMAIADGNANDFAVAAEDCIVCSIRLEDMQYFMMRNKAFNTSIYKLIGWRLRKIESKLSSIMFKNSTTRVLEFIKEFGQEFGQEKEDVCVVKNLLTHKEIAKLTFTSRQTVNAVFNKLKRNGNIDYDDKYIRIFDLQNT